MRCSYNDGLRCCRAILNSRDSEPHSNCTSRSHRQCIHRHSHCHWDRHHHYHHHHHHYPWYPKHIHDTLTGWKVALSDTHVFLLNEYFIELNTANFKVLNKLLNWILSGNKILNQLLNWILLKNENWINVWIEFVEKQTNE